MKKSIYSLACITLAAAGLVAGCGGGDDTTTPSTTPTPTTPATSQTCSAQGVTLTYSANKSIADNPFTDGQQVCFDATKTTLTYSGKTLTNPTQNTAVTGDYSAYKFVDGTTALEVIFAKDASVHEINVINATDVSKFFGQFAIAK